MDKTIVQGIIMIGALMCELLTLQAAPMSGLNQLDSSYRNTLEKRVLSGNSQQGVPLGFQKYAEVFEILERLNELKEEINTYPFGGASKHVILKTDSEMLNPEINKDIPVAKLHGRRNFRSKPVFVPKYTGIIVPETDSKEILQRPSNENSNEMKNASKHGKIDTAADIRAKRSPPNLDLSNVDLSSIVRGICLTDECLRQLKLYNAWREENGYPAYTGVWKVGR